MDRLGPRLSASVSAPVAISVRNRSRSSPQRRAAAAAAEPRRARRSRSRHVRRGGGDRAHHGGHPPGHVAAFGQAYLAPTTSATPGRRAAGHASAHQQPPGQRLGQRPGLRVGAGYSTAMSARPSLPCSCPSARPLSRLWKDAPPSSLSTVAAIQAASACSSAASSRVTTSLASGFRHQGSGPGKQSARDQRGGRDGLHRRRSRWPGWSGSSWPAPPCSPRGSRRRTGRDADMAPRKPSMASVRVADRGQPGAATADQPQQLVLDPVDVLVLVHADPRPAGAQPGRGGRVVAEHGDGQLNQAVEVGPGSGPSARAAAPHRLAACARPARNRPARSLEQAVALVGHLDPGEAQPPRTARAGFAGPGRRTWSPWAGSLRAPLPWTEGGQLACIWRAARRVNVIARKDSAGWAQSAIWWAIR